MIIRLGLSAFLVMMCGCFLSLPQRAEAQGWSLTAYGGQFFRDGLRKSLFGNGLVDGLDFRHSFIVTLSVAKEVGRWGKWLAWEVEGQVGKHFGIQDHWEFNALLLARWLPFPWDRYLDTSFAVGNGLSYATEDPEVEERFNDNETRRFVNALLLEFDFRLPRFPRWALVVRLHHRSGGFGLYGTSAGSNFLGLGIRYRF